MRNGGTRATTDEPGAAFFQEVYAAVRAIPKGRVATYGQIARLLGKTRGARAVGWALRALDARSEPRVPWHRVVGAGGRISLRGGVGPILQRRRLRAEGVRFKDGRVDMARHAWLEAPRMNAKPRLRRATRRERARVRRGRGLHG